MRIKKRQTADTVTPAIINAISSVLTAQHREMERRVIADARNYIDACRKGSLMRSKFCCDGFAEMAKLYWNPEDARYIDGQKRGDDIYSNGTNAINFRGEPFNYCPFCGEKL